MIREMCATTQCGATGKLIVVGASTLTQPEKEGIETQPVEHKKRGEEAPVLACRTAQLRPVLPELSRTLLQCGPGTVRLATVILRGLRAWRVSPTVSSSAAGAKKA